MEPISAVLTKLLIYAIIGAIFYFVVIGVESTPDPRKADKEKKDSKKDSKKEKNSD